MFYKLPLLFFLVASATKTLANPYVLAFKTAYEIFAFADSKNQEINKIRALNKEFRKIGECINYLADEMHHLRNLDLESKVNGLWGEYEDQWDDMIVNSQDLKNFSYRIANLLAEIISHVNSDEPKYTVMLNIPYYSLHTLQLLVEKQMIKVRGNAGDWDNYDKIRRLIDNGIAHFDLFLKVYKNSGVGCIEMAYKASEYLCELKKLYNRLKIDEHSDSLPDNYDFDQNKRYWMITISKFCSYRFLGINPHREIYETKNSQDWESFHIIPVGDGKYNLKDCHGHYLCAEPTNQISLAEAPGPWEEFRIKPWGGKGKMRYKIQSHWNNYLTFSLDSNPGGRHLILGRPGSQFTIKEVE